MRRRTVALGALYVFFVLMICQGVRLSVGSMVKTCNAMGSFSLPWPSVVLLFFMGGALVFFAVQWVQKATFSAQWPWLVLFSGGASNLFERLAYGCVTDYFVLPFFPTFNLADLLLTVGIAGLGFYYWQARQREP